MRMIFKRGLSVACFVLFSSVLATSFLSAAEPIRVLVVDGGHGYDKPAFAAMLASFGDELAITRATLPNDQKILAPSLAETIDVVLFYDQDQSPISDEDYANYEALFQSGVGVFALHHRLCSHPERSDFWKLIGGFYVFEQNRKIDGTSLPLSTYEHDVEFAVAVADASNPITAGVDDFTICDEVYANVYVAPQANVLLTTDCPKSTRELAWTWENGKSPVLALALGHDAGAFDNPNFRRILIQGVRWLNEESKRRRAD